MDGAAQAVPILRCRGSTAGRDADAGGKWNSVMTHNFNRKQRLKYLEMTDRFGKAWLEIFQDDTDFYSAAYWDLFINLWRAQAPVRKTDAMGFMKGVKSAHTAGKYVDTAITKGLLIESDNPDDARSKLIELTPDMRSRLDDYMNKAVNEVLIVQKEITSLGDVP